MDQRGEGLALVMGGGGARAAYQVGFLKGLARHYPRLRIDILTGVSAGAINAAHLASHPGTFQEAVDDLEGLWANLTVDQVFRVDARSLAVNLVRAGTQLLSGGMTRPHLRSLVDTAPLRRFLHRALEADPQTGEIPGIHKNLEAGHLRALAVSTASYTTGQSVVWVQGRDIHEWERPRRRSRRTILSVDHIMASAAIPLFFPAVKVEDGWYGDGGLQLAAPLSPALHLGAHRILALSTRYEGSMEEEDRPEVDGYPPLAQVIGVVMNGVFLDLLDQEAHRVEVLNQLLERLPPEARNGYRPVDLATLRPSRDLSLLANDFEPRLPMAFRFLTRGLGTRQTERPDALSIVLFQPDYLRQLMATGERDAQDQLPQLRSLLGPPSQENGGPHHG